MKHAVSGRPRREDAEPRVPAGGELVVSGVSVSRGAVHGLALWGALLTLVPTAVFAQDAHYARLRAQRGGECIAWQDRAFVYTVDAAGSAQVPGGQEFAAIDASFAAWQAAAEVCSDLTFTRAEPMTDATIGYDEEAASNANVLLFRETRCRDVVPAGDPCVEAGNCPNTYRCWNRGDFTIALTLTSYTSPGGVILDSDIELNASPRLDGTRFFFTTVDAPACDPAEPHAGCVGNDVQNTVTHELGHALGLDHVERVGSTMEATAPVGETSKRILDPGTRRGLCDVYPRSRPAPSCLPDARNDDQVMVLGRGTPGLPTFGCDTAASGPTLMAGALLLALTRLLHRGRRS